LEINVRVGIIELSYIIYDLKFVNVIKYTKKTTYLEKESLNKGITIVKMAKKRANKQ